MIELELKKKLYSKMLKEFDEFKENIKEYTFEKLLDMSYEYTIKNELLHMFYFENDYDIEEIRALYNCDNSLERLYDDWIEDDNSGINSMLEDCVYNSLETLIEEDETNKAINHLIDVTKKKQAQSLER